MTDTARFVQTGRWSGRLRVGGERFEVTPDRRRGIIGVGPQMYSFTGFPRGRPCSAASSGTVIVADAAAAVLGREHDCDAERLEEIDAVELVGLPGAVEKGGPRVPRGERGRVERDERVDPTPPAIIDASAGGLTGLNGRPSGLRSGSRVPASIKEILDRLTLGYIDLLIGTHALFQDTSRFTILHWQSCTSSTVSACTTARVDPQRRTVDVLVLPRRRFHARWRLPISATWKYPNCARSRRGASQSIPAQFLCRALRRSKRRLAARSPTVNAPIGSVPWSMNPRSRSRRRAGALRGTETEFGNKVDLVHGRMKGSDKDAAMARFASGEKQLLIATTVIEVGVDVPEATIMVIEHAERFGLAQLHQLRGRIGRGPGASTCLLLFRAPLAIPPRRASPFFATPKTGFGLPKRICGCAAKAMCSGRDKAACQAFIRPAGNPRQISGRRARRCGAHIVARRYAGDAPRRGPAPFALSFRKRRGDQADPRGLTIKP